MMPRWMADIFRRFRIFSQFSVVLGFYWIFRENPNPFTFGWKNRGILGFFKKPIISKYDNHHNNYFNSRFVFKCHTTFQRIFFYRDLLSFLPVVSILLIESSFGKILMNWGVECKCWCAKHIEPSNNEVVQVGTTPRFCKVDVSHFNKIQLIWQKWLMEE